MQILHTDVKTTTFNNNQSLCCIPGSLDRCIEGENADTILNNTPEISHVPILTPNTPLQVCSLNVGSNDSLIQVLLFDPQTLIMRLGKIEKMSKDIPKKAAPIKQVDAFKTYLYARRHFGTGKRRSVVLIVETCMYTCTCMFTHLHTNRFRFNSRWAWSTPIQTSLPPC